MLVALSGIDGSGKSTQLALIRQYCEDRGWRTKTIWTRGGYTSGFNFVRRLLRCAAGSRLPAPGPSSQRDALLGRTSTQKIWLTLALLDLLRVYCFQLRWWQMRNKVVLCDRYLWDAQIDFEIMFPGLNFHSWPLWHLLKSAAPRPTCAFLLWIPFDESVRRCMEKQEPFSDSTPTKAIRYSKYDQLAATGFPTALDARQPIQSIADSIIWAMHA